jgi:hypothetical protein
MMRILSSPGQESREDGLPSKGRMKIPVLFWREKIIWLM